MHTKTNLVIPPVGARPNLDTFSQIVRPAQEIGAQGRKIFSLSSEFASLHFVAVSWSSVV